MTETACHRWVHGALRTDRETLVSGLDLPPPLLPIVDTHRRLRGPYTAIGTVLRALVPDALVTMPELVYAHDVEVLSAAPELREVVPTSRETLTSLAVPVERTRFYSRMRTLRIAHGLTEFFRDYLPADRPRSLLVENVEYADPTDAELLSVLLRRIDPELLTLVICTGAGQLPEDSLATALTAYAEPLHTVPSTVHNQVTDVDPAILAAAYVATDCTRDDPRLLAGYQALPLVARAALHDQRAVELEARAEKSLYLGAIPFHREHGTDPGGAGAEALRGALDYCIDMGFYHATVDFGARGRAVIDWETQVEHWWAFTTKMTTSLAALSRAAEAEVLYDEARAFSTSPNVHMQSAYATAMLYTRHHEPEVRDDRKAKAWINEAIAIASTVPDAKRRAFQTVFNRNGLALIEVHLGNLPEALRLVNEGLDHLDKELGATEHRLHRSVLRYNRGQVYAGLGRLEDALADYTAVIAEDPNYAEYYFDRGNLLRRLDRDEEALADYETAMRLSPPFPEVFYNRGDIRASRGDIDGALADLDYVLELNPEFVDAYVNRAGIHLDADDLDAAHRDAVAGLAVDPDNPYLHVVLGQVYAEHAQYVAARAAFDRAVEADSELVAALSGRASVAYELGDRDAALIDLRRAVELAPRDAALRYNRAFLHQGAGRWDDALADLDTAAELAPGDPDITQAREQCRSKVAAA
jgi:tetratricopeptide (TPR) repeat protein